MAYSAAWPRRFEQEARLLRQHLHPWLVGGVEHIGSGSALWRERLAFRDVLRSNEGLRAEYQTLKQELALGADAVTTYTQGKRAFVSRVLCTAGIDLE